MPIRTRQPSLALHRRPNLRLSAVSVSSYCSPWRLPAAHRPTSSTRHPPSSSRRPPSRGRRRTITTSATTAVVHPPDTVPPRLRELHAALAALRLKAADHINLSQLPLILRGLASADGGVTRVAVVGFGDAPPLDTARALVRVLLADALGEKAAWEDELVDGEGAGAVLVRYGEEDTSGVKRQSQSLLYRELLVPSTLLLNHNVEILVTGLAAAAPPGAAAGEQEVDCPSDAILVPLLDKGSGAMVTRMRYPVHKALVVGEGAASCVRYGGFMKGEPLDSTQLEMIRFTANVTNAQPDVAADQGSAEALTFTDVARAAKAIDAFRQDVKNAPAFEQGWLHSGVPVLRNWLVAGVPISGTSETPILKPVLRNLILHLLTRASANIETVAARKLAAAQANAPSALVVKELETALEKWSGKAHEELEQHSSPRKGFAGARWNRITWRKLFWRVDDVAMVTQDTVEHRWLVEADKGCYRLIGRFEAAGLLGRDSIAKVTELSRSMVHAGAGQSAEAVVETTDADTKSNEAAAAASVDANMMAFTGIGRLRALRAHEAGVALQSQAHRALLRALSTISMTSGLSALLYFSTSFSTFEAGSVGVFGLVWALRQLQKQWHRAEKAFEGGLKEEGRLAIKRIEDRFLGLLAEAREMQGGDGPDAKESREALEAIYTARTALNELERRPMGLIDKQPRR